MPKLWLDLSCINRVNSSTKQCVYHICRICAVGSRKVILYASADINYPQSQLCSKHRCSSPDLCPKEVANSSAFCTSHSCRECISIKSNPIQAAVNKAPRNTCNKHQLCSFTSVKGKECISVVNGTSMYCLKHTEDNKAITRSQQKTSAPRDV